MVVAHRGRFTKEKARHAHKRKAIIRHAGKTYYARRKACAWIAESSPTLSDWTISCPLTDGEGIETLPLPTAYNRTITYFLKDDLDRIRRAKAKLKMFPVVPGHTYIVDAIQASGACPSTFYKRLKANKVGLKYVLAKSKNGQVINRAYVPNNAAIHPQATEGKQSIAKAAEALGIQPQSVRALIRRGVLTATPGRIECTGHPTQGTYVRAGHWLSEESVKQEKDRRQKKQPSPAVQRAADLIERELLPGPKLRRSVWENAQRQKPPISLAAFEKGKTFLRIQSERTGSGFGNLEVRWSLPPERAANVQRSAAKMTPPPQVPSCFSQRQHDLLDALLGSKAFSSTDRDDMDDIAARLNADPATLRRAAKTLKLYGLIDTKRGREGGLWLTEVGKQVAENL